MITKSVFGLAFASSALIACAQPTAEDDYEDGDGDTEPVVAQPHDPVCSGGMLQCYAQIRVDDAHDVQTFAAPQGYGPADLASAYHIKTSLGTAGTIAVVDAYNYAAAESDLGKYRAKFGLPACTTANGCFRRVNQNGAASPLPHSAPAGDDWTVEAALDLDMASAACPSCKLILVEAQDDQGDGLYIANSGAASLHPTVISNSWGGSETGDEASLETYFTHAGIAIFASSGDDGYTGASPQYPSTSPHVTAVGGTTLTRSSNTRGWADKAWSDAGSSCSSEFAQPSYQVGVVAGCSKRAASDVSAVADPDTGVAVYNAANGGWIVVGGTSASSPLVAGMYALYGLGAKAPGWAYSNTADFYDVKSGRNGSCGNTALCKAGVGWDGPTGIGVPNGSKL